MNSAFGIDHGEVSKSYNKLLPKLAATRKAIGFHEKTRDMDTRMRSNYILYRKLQGGMGKGWSDGSGADVGRQQKAMAQTQLIGLQSRNKKTRFLP